ncbi:hypothetical protein BBJ28_00024144 [Nothophytophthora sp. Chile5]|nr:hypothetical protein BBJ28_00024144 [Nothophytophthora sp. Chile5]
MERARIRRRQQQFQTEFDAQTRELRLALAEQQSRTSSSSSSQTRLVLTLRYKLGELCAQYDEFRLAVVYFQQVLTSVESSRPGQDDEAHEVDEEAAEMAALHGNALNWLATMHFRAGDHSEAMDLFFEAKKLSREGSTLLDWPLTVNYALFLHARGNVVDAEQAAQSVVNEGEADSVEESETDTHARSTAFMCESLFALVLASISKARGDSTQALALAERAVALANRVQDPRLCSRAHNNLGIYCLEQGDVERALTLFASAYRATKLTCDFEQQAVVKYHLGLALAYLKRSVSSKQELGGDEEGNEAEVEEEQQQPSAKAETKETMDGESASLSPPVSDAATLVVALPTAAAAKTPKEFFLASENLASALATPDDALRVLAQSCRGEEEYYAGEFHTAEAEFTIALGQLREFAGSNFEDQDVDTVIGASFVIQPPLPPELAKLQGLLLSYIGCTQLVEGKFSLAERSHKRDWALALRQEDLHAQHRALRNLAIVYNATQRYVEAVPLWREALELSVVLNYPGEQLMAYSGLGTALKELIMVEGLAALEAAGLNSGSQPLQVFLRQRELAEQVGDRHQQILAQRYIVSMYESAITKPQTDGEAGEALERRLAECDALVQLCEQYESLQYRADAYRSLANALTAQVARLRARARGDGTSAPHFGLTEAIAVLSQKRDGVCTSYLQVSASLTMAATLMFEDAQDDNNKGESQHTKPKPEERHARPPLTRLEILQRR